MASINQRNGKLFFDFRWQGKRFREYTDLPDTPGNLKKAKAVLKHLEGDIRKGTFTLEDYFPDSPRIQKTPPTPDTRSPQEQPQDVVRATQVPPAPPAVTTTPTFSHFAENWYRQVNLLRSEKSKLWFQATALLHSSNALILRSR